MNLMKWRSGQKAAAASTATAETAAPRSGNAAPSGPQGVTLQDVVLLKVALSWQEAVAVILELIAGLPSRHAFPDPAQVMLSDIGEVRTHGSRTLPGHPSRAAAASLRELLGGATAPAELRAIVDQNASGDPRHKTLDEFVAALAYFERPGRRGDVAAVYARAHSLYVKALADLELERLRSKAMREQVTNEPRPATGTPWYQRAVGIALVAVLCGVIGAGGLTLFSMAFAPAPGQDDGGNPVEPNTPTETLSAATGEAKRLVSAGIEMATALIGRAAAGTTGVSETPPVAPQPPVRVRRTNTSATLPPTAAAPDVASLATSVTRSVDAPIEWTVSVRDVTATMKGGVIEDLPPPTTDRDNLPLFSLSDEDVTPATLVRPQLPSRMTDVGEGADASTLDLTIDETGRVERVILESQHSQVNEKMLVSAAKAWLFQPAIRDGRPVRYRLRVQISE